MNVAFEVKDWVTNQELQSAPDCPQFCIMSFQQPMSCHELGGNLFSHRTIGIYLCGTVYPYAKGRLSDSNGNVTIRLIH